MTKENQLYLKYINLYMMEILNQLQDRKEGVVNTDLGMKYLKYMKNISM